MDPKNKVIAVYPQAQVEERFYGNRFPRFYAVFLQPWSIVELGRGSTRREAWENAERNMRKTVA